MIKRDELSNPQSCLNRAADDEMLFVLLGRDSAAPFAIRAWAMERIRLGKNTADDPQIKEALECARLMSSRGGPELSWESREDIHALVRGSVIVNYLRWSESGECWVDFKGTDLGRDLESAQQACEKLAREAHP